MVLGCRLCSKTVAPGSDTMAQAREVIEIGYPDGKLEEFRVIQTND